jgi:hypothetical protein
MPSLSIRARQRAKAACEGSVRGAVACGLPLNKTLSNKNWAGLHTFGHQPESGKKLAISKP